MNSLQRELLKQILKVKIRDNRPSKVEDFDLFLSRDGILENLNALFKDGFIEINDIYNEVQFHLTDLGRKQIKLVLTGGAYDLLHIGHIKTLKEASSYGDFLLVVVAKDSTVEDRKRKPIHNENQRTELLNELKIVDLAVAGNKTDHMAIVRTIRPDIIAIGSDQDHRIKNLKKQLTEENMSSIILTRLTSSLEGLSTTEVITEILERFV